MLSITPIGMEQPGAVEGAQIARMYLQRGNPGADELVTRGAPEIEVRLLTAREPGRRFRVTREMASQIAAHLIAARTDARTDRGDDVFSARSIPRRQCAHSDDCRTSRCALPPGVNRRHCTGSAVGEEERNAVRCLDGEHKRAIIGHRDVRFRIARFSPPRLEYVRTVHLAHARDALRRDAQRERKIAPSGPAEGVKREIARAEAVASDPGERTAP
jgi:hypothetical protein